MPGKPLASICQQKRVPRRLVFRDGFWLLWDAGRPFRARPHPFQTARRSGMAKSRAGTPAVASRNARNQFQNASRPETLESRSGTPAVPKRQKAVPERHASRNVPRRSETRGVLKRHFLAWDTLPCAGTPESGPAQVLRLPKGGRCGCTCSHAIEPL